MVSKIWLINAVFALLVAFFGLKAYEVWVQENKGLGIPEMARKPTQGVAKSVGMLDKRKMPPESEYNALMAKNLFLPERTEIFPDETKTNEVKAVISPAQQKNLEQFLKRITLYGMVITDNFAEALVSDPTFKPVFKRGTKLGVQKTPKENRRKVKQTKWVKAGDVLGDFQVESIKPDRVLLKAGGQSYALLLYDKEKVRIRAPVKPKTGPTVVGTAVTPLVPKVKEKRVLMPSSVRDGVKNEKAAEEKAQLGERSQSMRENFERVMKKPAGAFGRPQ